MISKVKKIAMIFLVIAICLSVTSLTLSLFKKDKSTSSSNLPSPEPEIIPLAQFNVGFDDLDYSMDNEFYPISGDSFSSDLDLPVAYYICMNLSEEDIPYYDLRTSCSLKKKFCS